MKWTVYLLASRARTYVGITTDLRRRLAQHNGAERGGAKSTRGGRPWRIAARFGPFATRGVALRLEHRLKRLRRRERLLLAASRRHRLALAALVR
jgi:structure-specific endonuclease subunit SLX1